MKRRDLAWRLGGLLLIGIACAGSVALRDTPTIVLLVPLAFLGLPCAIHGKRVPQAFRAEHHGHGRTVEAVHAARLRARSGDHDDVSRRQPRQ